MQQMRLPAIAVALASVVVGCQSYDFIFQPNSDRQAVHLRFDVQRPSKTDILFVVDNSVSMAEEQAALGDAFTALIDALAPQDTRYRIGITSTDAIGDTQDCAGTQLTGANSPGAKGNCSRLDVILRRPHDGALGRLIGAYDPNVFDVAGDPNGLYTNLTPEEHTLLAKLLPTSMSEHPPEYAALFAGFSGYTPPEGVRWVIDREVARLEACLACDCTTTHPVSGLPTCDETEDCYQLPDSCVHHLAPKVVEAYFRSNIAGLGTNGAGYEEGLKTGLLAVGVDATDLDDDTAVQPAGDLTLVGRPNSFVGLDDDGVPTAESWTREQALLAVMFVSDEQDCSMPPSLYFSIDRYEETPPPGERTFPHGAACYRQDVLGGQFLSTARMSRLLTDKKGGTQSRVATGFIGGVELTGVSGTAEQGTPIDCIQAGDGTTSRACECLNGTSDPRWCCMSIDDRTCSYPEYINGTATATPLGQCEALAGSRYVYFDSAFSRRVFDSICKADFSEVMQRFADITVVACFELAPEAAPQDGNADYIVVRRASREEAEAGNAPVLLPRRDSSSTEAGWYYELEQNRICLTGIDRAIGDVYDIFILKTDFIEFGN